VGDVWLKHRRAKDCLDTEFLKQQFNTALLSASITLQAAGSTNSIVISERPLLFVRGGMLVDIMPTRFSRRIFIACSHDAAISLRPKGFERRLRQFFDRGCSLPDQGVADNRERVVQPVWYSWKYPTFYKRLVPALARRERDMFSQLPYRLCWYLTKRVVRSFVGRLARSFIPLHRNNRSGGPEEFQSGSG